MEPKKNPLWMNRSSLREITYKKNIKYGFRTTCTRPLKPKAMDNMFSRPSKVYIIANVNNARN
jgi:hypothetical protein